MYGCSRAAAGSFILAHQQPYRRRCSTQIDEREKHIPRGLDRAEVEDQIIELSAKIARLEWGGGDELLGRTCADRRCHGRQLATGPQSGATLLRPNLGKPVTAEHKEKIQRALKVGSPSAPRNANAR
jgi:hypothetical protein